MRRIPMLLLLALGACQTTTGSAPVDRDPRDLLLSLEGGTGLDDRIGRRALDEVAATMQARGFRVFDTAALGANGHSGGALAAARASLDPPVGTVVLVALDVDRQDRPHTRRIRVSVGGRLVDVASGLRLGAAEATGTGNIRPDCRGPCDRAETADIAKPPAREVAEILATRLGGAAPATVPARGMLIAFEGFAPEELRAIEARLDRLPGYLSHRPVANRAGHAEIRFESAARPSRMHRHMERLLGELDLRVRTEVEGNTWRFRRIRVPLAARQRAHGYDW